MLPLSVPARHVHRVCQLKCRASSNGSSSRDPRQRKVEKLRELLKAPGVLQGPACHDALSAKLVQLAGFDMAFMSGFCVSASRLGLPDAGLISYGEMVEQARLIAGAVNIPVIADGDTGYGNAMNVKRTVHGFAEAGMAGILLEDQIMPKACGHTQGRRVVSREEAIMRIRAAADARDEGQDIVIVARTDARQAESLDEALWRVQAFADAGADVLFIDALSSRSEMAAFCEAARGVPKMANMLEGGGRTPILTPLELEDLGFKLVAYPLSLLGVSIRAMQDALGALKGGRMPTPAALPSFDEIKEVVGFPAYYQEEERYALPRPSEDSTKKANRDAIRPGEGAPGSSRSTTVPDWQPLKSDLDAEVARMAAQAEQSGAAARVASQLAAEEAIARAGASSPGGGPNLFWGGTTAMPGTVIDDGGPAAEGTVWQTGGVAGEGGKEIEESTKSERASGPIEADAVNEGGVPGTTNKTAASGDALFDLFGASLRLVISGRDGRTKLETRIPAAFLNGLASTIPAVAGLNLQAMLREASSRQAAGSSQAILDFDSRGDRIQIFLE